jgi:transposase
MKAAVEQAHAAGFHQLPAAIREQFVVRYHALLATGHAANPPPDPQVRRPRHRGRMKQTPAQNLLEHLWLGQDQVLAFLNDLTIPFDNNQAERDLRMLKVQQKISGAFRSVAGRRVQSHPRLSLDVGQTTCRPAGRARNPLHRPAALPHLCLSG